MSQPLSALISSAENELARVMTICNACRYCEGFCAVFPAMTRRLEFDRIDVHYLANLCHSCGACLHSCQYAPPHEFAVNVPKAMAQVRGETYARYAWPNALGALYRSNGLTVAVALALGLSLFISLLVAMHGSLLHEPLAGNFYAVFPHGLMAGLFGLVSVWIVVAIGVGLVRFWRDSATPPAQGSGFAAATQAGLNAATLTYLDGCSNDSDASSPWRRRMHHLTMYGFLLCFASTSVATLYHYLLGRVAPYPLFSVPVLLGVVGGVMLAVGSAGLAWLAQRRHPLHRLPSQQGMDSGFVVLLFLTAVTGLALLAFRDGRVMALWLSIHLGIVLALFLTLPYGKFVHGFYRVAALLKFQIERRLPSNLKLGGE